MQERIVAPSPRPRPPPRPAPPDASMRDATWRAALPPTTPATEQVHFQPVEWTREQRSQWADMILEWWREKPQPRAGRSRVYFSKQDIMDILRVGRRRMAPPWAPYMPQQWIDVEPDELPPDAGTGVTGVNGVTGVTGGTATGATGNGYGAALLALLAAVLLVRAAEKCFHKLFRPTARRTDMHAEWTNSVPAVSGCRIEELDAEESEPTMSAPPPYAQAMAIAGPNAGAKVEDPPPPYSECYVPLKSGPVSVTPEAEGSSPGEGPAVTGRAGCACDECAALRLEIPA